MTDLDDLLQRATDRIQAPDLARQALTGARRRRNRNRGVVAAAVAAAAVVAVAVSVELTTGSARVDPAPAHTSSPMPTPDEDVAVAPEIARSAIQPVWDPRGAEGLPVVDLGVPRVMESLVPGEVSQPVAVLDDGQRALLVSGDGHSAELTLPEGLGQQRIVSLSPDGTRLAAIGTGGFFWRTLDGDWQRILKSAVSGEGAQVTWLPDGSGLIGRDWNSAARIELPSGDVEELPLPEETGRIDVGADGVVVTTVPRQVVEWSTDGEESRTATGPLEGLVLPEVGSADIAFARANLVLGDRPADRDGLIVVDRDTFETRSYLPVPDDHYYVHAEELRPVAWLDDDTLAFTVLPKDAPKEYLLTWNVETGELSRISCWYSSDTAVFATDLLR